MRFSPRKIVQAGLRVGGVAALALTVSGNLALPSRAQEETARFYAIPDLAGGGVIGSAEVISADGSTVGGHADSAASEGFRFGSGREAFRFVLSNSQQQALGDLPGVPFGEYGSFVSGLSADGNVVLGFSFPGGNQRGWRWTAAGGMLPLALLAGGSTTVPADISADGAGVVGRATSTQGEQAVWWTTGATTPLGDLPGGAFASRATAIADGAAVIVGQATSAEGAEAFRWTPVSGMVSLGDLPGGPTDSIAVDVSNDGATVAGTGASGNSQEAFVWTQAGGMRGLGTLRGDSSSVALGISSSGTAIYGRSIGDTTRGFIWTASSGMQDLGRLPGVVQIDPRAASADLTTIVGVAYLAGGGFTSFVWDRFNGMREVRDLLASAGLSDEASAYGSLAINNVSADGRVIVGEGVLISGGTQGWAAFLPAPPLTGTLEVPTRKVKFKKARVGTPATALLQVSNSGEGRLPVTIELPPPFFVSTNDGSFSLGPGETRSITVTFDPTAPGKYKSLITVSGGSAQVQVPVIGKAKKAKRVRGK